MVQLVDSEDEVENSVTEKPIQAKARPPRSPIKRSRSTKTTEKATKPRSIKKETPGVEGRSKVEVTVAVNSSDGRSKMIEVPRFMLAAWSSSFLPTIYDSLGRSKKPFAHFSKGPDIVTKLQEAIDLVWPGTDYDIQWSDLACSKVSNFICMAGYSPSLFSFHVGC